MHALYLLASSSRAEAMEVQVPPAGLHHQEWEETRVREEVPVRGPGGRRSGLPRSLDQGWTSLLLCAGDLANLDSGPTAATQWRGLVPG